MPLRVCREAGARVATNVLLRDMDLAAFNALGQPWVGSGGGRSDTVARCQFAIDRTLVSPMRRDGTAKRRAANHDA